MPLFSADLAHGIQIVSATAKTAGGRTREAHERLRGLRSNTPVVVRGLVRVRDAAPPGRGVGGDVRKIGTREIELWDVQPLNEFPKDIIFKADTNFPPEQRHLQIRRDKRIRDALAFRSRAAGVCRSVLGGLGFEEIDTPVLFRSTPEGAREFIVPTRNRGLAYALPQSPQQFKQLLMASGISRYYQMAKCFRDEDSRADRQPEFTQLDLEMSFASGEQVMQCVEELVRSLWRELLAIDLPSPFGRLTYREAMSRYGSDKPDLRLRTPPLSRIDHMLPLDLIGKLSRLRDPAVEMHLLPLGAAAGCLPRETREFVRAFMESPDALAFLDNPDGGPGIFVYDSGRPLSGLHAFGFEAAGEVERALHPEDGDLIVIQARRDVPFAGGGTALGRMRSILYRRAAEAGLLPEPEGFEPLWITDFPLFSPSCDSEPGQGGAAGLASTHHPFTAPKTRRDVDLLLTDPSTAIGEHYDLVINGVELGGGSRRIHHAGMQRFIMSDILKMSEARIADFGHLLEALRAGCPPHAGIALGFDRLVAVMLGRNSVRDVMAFPKGGRGEDLFVKSPSVMSEEALRTYHLRVRDD
jgi:aspartyl-tRNA synthetase